MLLERGFLSFEPLFRDIDVFFRVSVGNQAIRVVMEAYMEDYYFPYLAKALSADVPAVPSGKKEVNPCSAKCGSKTNAVVHPFRRMISKLTQSVRLSLRLPAASIACVPWAWIVSDTH